MSDTETTAPAPEATEPSAEESIDELPEWARKALDKANREAAGYRTKLREVEPLAAKARELEESQKSESQKLAEAQRAAEERASAAERERLRLEVALDKAPDGMPLAQIRKLAKRLTGSTVEELETDAAELFGEFVPVSAVEPARTPRERLRPGASPTEAPSGKDMNSFLARAVREKRSS